LSFLVFVKVDIVLLDVDDGLAKQGKSLADELRSDLGGPEGASSVPRRIATCFKCNWESSITSFEQLALAIASLRRIMLSS
jgi:hypothetical protein